MPIIQRGSLEAVIASYSGTGADVVLDLGFIPAYANGLDVTSGMNQWWWSSGFSSTTAAASQTVWAVTASQTGAAIGGFNYATVGRGAGGIVPLDGSAGTGIGLTIGTDTIANVAGHAYVVTAWQLH